jgi:hypothetical protein
MIAAEPLKLPLSCPGWITPELVADTLETWQPHCKERLTLEDAIGILNNVGNLTTLAKGEWNV